ncbi:hypothetical protein EKO04_009768 [Ascochyta lentis]|uniref:Uncharacterized protein n=1 Tax=Ascochyta lentis TaxID=205686 RepID=A0A8H7IX01_9PLEO|nr:hypothetical protein EKO04_009768 [Ascochyta lentis]
MKVELVVALTMTGVALSGPARRGCGQEKCYDAVNECGMTYGGCWTECGGGVTEIPTFTAPPCSDVGYPTQSSDAGQDNPSSTDSEAVSSITPPPSLTSNVATPSSESAPSTCSPLWLCIDYMAVCGDTSQMYGGCYDTCTSAPPFESPPCTLSSTATETSYATNVATPGPGVAYTEKPASDDISPAIDDNKALVMAEMPNTSEPAPAPEASETPAPDAGEFRVAEAQANEPEPADTNIVEAPAVPEGGTMRGNAILKIMADKDRVPNTANVPCYDAFCKEAQLGPSQVPEA